MRVEQLENLIAVIQRGSFRKAGEQLHLSQPALSESVRNLERELGVTLLDRRRTGARISREGRDLLPSINEVLEAVDRLRSAANNKELPSRIVRVGVETGGHTPVVAPAVRALREQRPNTAVEIVGSQQSELFTAVAEGSLDLGLVNVLPGDDVPPELGAVQLLCGRPMVRCRNDHAFAALDQVTVEALRAEPVVSMGAGHLTHRLSDRLFGSDRPPISVSSDDADMVTLLVAEGLGVTVLPDYSIVSDPMTEAGVVVHRPLQRDAPQVSLMCVHRAGHRLPPAVRELSEQLVGHAKTVARQVPCSPGPHSRVS